MDYLIGKVMAKENEYNIHDILLEITPLNSTKKNVQKEF